jgi:uncharacterized protein YegL
VPKENLTEIIVVMDKSGSMDSIKGDAMGAFNTFLEEQQKLPGDAAFTLTLFDTAYDLVHTRKPIKDVPKLSENTYVPGGMTALLDAVGRTIDEVGRRLNDTPEEERPSRVVMAIITDGQENSSHEYKRQQVFDKIKTQKDAYQWEFVFLAAGQEAFKEAEGLGLSKSSIVAMSVGDPQAYVAEVRNFSHNVTNYRSGENVDWQRKH